LIIMIFTLAKCTKSETPTGYCASNYWGAFMPTPFYAKGIIGS
jgi:hypothetical protein